MAITFPTTERIELALVCSSLVTFLSASSGTVAAFSIVTETPWKNDCAPTSPTKTASDAGMLRAPVAKNSAGMAASAAARSMIERTSHFFGPAFSAFLEKRGIAM